MRPRHKAAENPPYLGVRLRLRQASMRLRHKAAENLDEPLPVVDGIGGFNEAAA